MTGLLIISTKCIIFALHNLLHREKFSTLFCNGSTNSQISFKPQRERKKENHKLWRKVVCLDLKQSGSVSSPPSMVDAN